MNIPFDMQGEDSAAQYKRNKSAFRNRIQAKCRNLRAMIGNSPLSKNDKKKLIEELIEYLKS